MKLVSSVIFENCATLTVAQVKNEDHEKKILLENLSVNVLTRLLYYKTLKMVQPEKAIV